VNKGSNEQWVNPHDPEAEIAKLKDGRTHLAYKAEHAVDLETGAVVAVTVSGGAAGDTQTILETLAQAGEHIAEVACTTNKSEVGERVRADGPQEAVADKGYHSNDTLQVMAEVQVRSYISEPDRGQRHWEGKAEAQQAVSAIGDASTESGARNCCGGGESCWNAASRMRMRREGCGAYISADEKMFSNVYCCRQGPSIFRW